jgi:transcription antitermination factor NusG
MEHVKENTSLWWALRIKDPTIRDNLVRALKEQNKENKELAVLNLGAMITWNATTEGHEYWCKLNNGAALELLDTPYTQNSGEERLYEVGEWVTCVRNDKYGNPIGIYWKEGTVFQIKQVSGDRKWESQCVYPNVGAAGTFSKFVRPATAAEIATVVKDEWKTGDKLPAEWLNTVTLYERQGAAKGVIHGKDSEYYQQDRTVQGINEGWAKVTDSSDWLKPKSNYPTYPGTTEKKVEPVVSERMYKVGDRVKIIKGKPAGQIGTVEELGVPGLYWIKTDAGERLPLLSGEEGCSKEFELYKEPVPEKWSIVTTDGVKVYEKAEVYWYHVASKSLGFEGKIYGVQKHHEYSIGPTWLLFSTYEAAEEYRKKQCGETTDVQWACGDWVEVLDTANVRRMGKKEAAIGHRWQLSKDDANTLNEGHVVVCPDNRYCINYKAEDLKKVDGPHPTVTSIPTKAPTTTQEYKVGQRVIVHSGANNGNHDKGKGEITRVDTDYRIQPCIRVKFDNTECDIWCYEEHSRKFHVEILSDKIPTPPIPVERKWKVGDMFTTPDTSIATVMSIETVKATVKWDKIDGSTKNGPVPISNIDKWIQEGKWVPYTPEPTMVTLDNVYIGMKVVANKKYAAMYSSSTEKGGIVSEILKDRVIVNWVCNQSGLHDTKLHDLYVAPGETITNTNKQTNQVTTNQKTQTNDKQSNSTQHQDSSKCTISNSSSGTALDLRDDQERVITGSRRPGNSLRCDGQPELTARKHSSHTKGVGYCEKV